MTIENNLFHIRQMVADVATARPVTLLAVSKTFAVEAIEKAMAAGQLAFGENYVQEGVEKIHYFKQKHPSVSIEWHMIGPIQSNKTKLVAENFDWVQSVDREKIASRLSAQRPDNMPDLNVLIEVNVDEQESKSGVNIDEVELLLEKIMALPKLRVRGLMCIPNPDLPQEQKRRSFQKMKALFDELNAKGYPLDVLSMGMSADFQEAIRQGATLVRVGSAIFGARDYSNKS